MVEWDGLENRCGRKLTVGSNPTLSAKHPQHLSLLPGTFGEVPEQAGFRVSNRIGGSFQAVSSAISGGICAGRLWRDQHRCGLPDKQVRTGKFVNLMPKTGRFEPVWQDET